MRFSTASLVLPAAILLATSLPTTGVGLAQGVSAAASQTVPMCRPEQLSLGTDGENGNFDGMSHSGTLVVLRNIGSTACRVDAIPQITFADATHDLPAKGRMQGARFMHPGPVVLPVIVAAGAEVTSALRWVSGEVYEKSTCITSTKITVKVAGGSQTAAFAGHLCGDAAQGGVLYDMTRFAPDPVYDPKANSR